ncbi:glutathione S-transferase C-terminal domain-containing protein homolog [Toxorhynchites rutilus septentrionalis]|uniref:glutathione S-transferase C-terminal domain-containing protein homolog n=1 Tax=Toxorhynchites rutilus septentrionalis TaxID=329112 RepID=UPI0024794E57|nr:glutathione S-transferase C-terminal domain-containing protein homolog [Toxorhynchites rutilus septentrionalis]
MIKLYLECFTKSSSEDRLTVKVSLESYIVLVLCKYLSQPEIGVEVQINFVQSKIESMDSSHTIVVNLQKLGIEFYEQEHWPYFANFCQLPTLTCNAWVISGLCGICRRVTKSHIELSKNPKRILGFKGNTLLAPAEISIWTKFCEVDIEKCVRVVLEMERTSSCTLPEDLGKLESHLAQPLKVHNIYKLINNVHNVKISSNQEYLKLENDAERFDFYANHKFVEGYEKTLADIMLYICVNIIMKRIPLEKLEKKLPKLVSWYNLVTADDDFDLENACNDLLSEGQSNLEALLLDQLEVLVPESYSLYKADTKKMNLLGEKILTTNQAEVLGILDKVKCLKLDIGSAPGDRDSNLFDWDDVPIDAKPEGGKLPNKRVQRKKHQLECLANEVITLARPGDVIVDFCSGTGHLGILLAYLLPECTIYLLENKEESQQLATERVKRLGLTNVVYLQCNLDYFEANFDIGVSLHACGVATDIVLEKCFNRNANFVCCPCCYGKLYEFDRVRYPRSKVFQQSNLLLKEYLCIAHCADQTHDLDNDRTNVEKSHQGFYCMDVIDKDRALRAEEFGYTVKQKRLNPENCTPKNRILVGRRK